MSDKYDREAALLVCGVDIPVDRKVVKVADALREQGKEIDALKARKIAIVGGCECGIGYIDIPDSIDSGATFRCEAGHPIVFDVATPEHRAAEYIEPARLRAEIDRLKAQRLLLAKLASDDVLYVSYDVVTARKLRDEVLEESHER
jgi:hypothetical protein